MKTKLTLFVAVVAFCFQQGLVGADLKKGLVAYYPFNENSQDESGNGNHAGVNGANFSLDRHGQPDRAYSFDGKVDVIQKEGGYEVLGSHSVSVWVKTSKFETSEGGRHRRILVNRSGKGNYFGLSVIGPTQVGFGFYTTYKGVQHRAKFVAEKLLAEKIAVDWIHVVGVFREDKSINIFINGEQKTPLGDVGGYLIENKNMFCIGNDSAPNRGCVGSIDDVRIYNRALSAEEVKALYDLEKPKTK